MPPPIGAWLKKAYTHSPLAISVMRGELGVFHRPSGLENWLLPTQQRQHRHRQDQNAHAAQPLQKVRHTLTERANYRPLSTVEPGGLKPEPPRNTHGVNETGRPLVQRQHQRQRRTASSTHTSVTSITPWRGSSSRR